MKRNGLGADNALVPEGEVLKRIYQIRKQKVMLDRDLADLYGVETKQLKRAVRRSSRRFPEDFMFVLNKDELDNLRCQFGTSSWGGSRYLPMAFTEQGVAMLSSVLNSDRAIEANIQIIRIFIKLRSMLMNHKDLIIKMNELETKVQGHDKSIREVLIYLKRFIISQEKPREKIGF